ncbi:two-component system response regulator CreB [Buttiauxella sp. A2-C1_F]|uniref:two-component system response regulator CreB n=1 Tax=Buttiauxella sp. A2-C1_F TaxID=2904526 RepID=UPI001E5900EA|nr:two-component system response regulator CreB [Buttiauxella sp. A2-C1_F]MCE0845618.1 two-component system response regulator CreB [Buttiauxella sp. A2-C1_F]
MNQATIWLVEDETSIADTLIYTLQQEGFSVRAFDRGLPVLKAAHEERPDLAILDVGLPDINGFELCRRLLADYPDLPLLFLTARSEEVDRLIGLEIGADDYIAKPFSPREVCARVRTVLRRLQKQRQALAGSTQRIGLFEFNEMAAQISWCQQSLQLTRYEYLLLKTFLQWPGRVFSRQQLMDLVWSTAEESFDRTVDTHIKTLRAKLRAINPDLSPINTHRGLGYSLGVN